MTQANCLLSVPDPSTEGGSATAIRILERQLWNFIIGAMKGVDWFSMGLPGWDVVFTGTYPEFSRATFTEQGATGRIIQIDYTYSGGLLTDVTVQYDDADGSGFISLVAPRLDMPAGDRVARAPVYDFKRPYQTYNVGGGAAGDGDDFAMRENLLALTCIAMCETDDPQNYNFSGVTFTPTLRTDGKVQRMLMQMSSSELEVEIIFTHYEDDLYDDDNARIRTAEVRVKRGTAESFYTLGKWLYNRRANGAMQRITQLS